MKNNFIIIAAVTLAFTACSDRDMRNDIQDEQVEIGFSTFTGKLTRAENSNATAKNALNTHHTTFEVWGYKTINSDKSLVFGADNGAGTEIDWNSTDNIWQYSPLRFWDKSASSYSFFAAAPESAAWTYTNDKISLANFSVDGSSLDASSSIDADADFGTQDIMISEDVTVLPAAYTTAKVQLDFIHLLTRLNIGIKKSATLNDYYVKLKSIKVYNLVDGGNFSETTAAIKTGSIARWADNNSVSANSKAGYGYATDTEVKGNYNYVYQSLFIPQQVDYVANVALNGTGLDANSKPYIKINYEFYSGVKYTEQEINDAQEGDDAYGKEVGEFKESTLTLVDTYNYSYNLADIFNGTDSDDDVQFCEGWMNTLQITIEPVAINFDAKVYEWEPTTDVPVDVPDINPQN